MLVIDMLLSQKDGFPSEWVGHIGLGTASPGTASPGTVGAASAARAWGSPHLVQADF